MHGCFRGCFLPDKSLVANEQNNVSRVCKDWLLYLQDDKLIPEVPILIDKSTLTYDDYDLHRDKLNEDNTEYYKGDRHTSTVDAVCKKRN